MGMAFTWTNSEEGAPARKHLSIGLRLLPETKTEISISVERWPDPNKVPVYPGAIGVKTASVQEFGDGPLNHVITYVVDAQPSAIRTYYEKVMIDHGWSLAPSELDSVTFNYGRGGGGYEGSAGSKVRVRIEASPGESTKVALTVIILGEDWPSD
jgi:hypothetical protein